MGLLARYRAEQCCSSPPSGRTSSTTNNMSAERTFIAVKPDGVQRGLIGEIIKRFEQKGFKMCGMKFMQASEEHMKKHYEVWLTNLSTPVLSNTCPPVHFAPCAGREL